MFMSVLNEHDPSKKKYIHANNGPFLTKALRKDREERNRETNV